MGETGTVRGTEGQTLTLGRSRSPAAGNHPWKVGDRARRPTETETETEEPQAMANKTETWRDVGYRSPLAIDREHGITTDPHWTDTYEFPPVMRIRDKSKPDITGYATAAWKRSHPEFWYRGRRRIGEPGRRIVKKH